MDMLTQWGTILSPYFCISDHHGVYFKYHNFICKLYLNKAGGYTEENEEYGQETTSGPHSQKYYLSGPLQKKHLPTPVLITGDPLSSEFRLGVANGRPQKEHWGWKEGD